jgi:predicted esterase
MNTMYSKDNHCNYDIVIGHSQGAILTAALLSVNSKLWTDDNSPTGYIFNGVAWPNPFESYMQGLTQQVKQHQSNNSQLPPMLFIMGKSDDINPIQSAKQVSDAFSVAGFNVAIVEHDGGHSVPYKSDDDSKRALEEVVDWIMRIAEQSKIQL